MTPPLRPASTVVVSSGVKSAGFGHRHPVNQQHIDQATFGQRAAEKMAKTIGSWRFLIVQSCLLAVWITFNVWAIFVAAWDPYPFILLNLMLSFQAAYTGPILLIAANRGAERDRLLIEHEAEEVTLMQTLLTENTELTRAIHTLTSELHAHMHPKDGD